MLFRSAGNVRQQILYNEIIAYERLGNYKEAKTKASEYLEEYTDEAMQKEYEFIKTRSREEVE